MNDIRTSFIVILSCVAVVSCIEEFVPQKGDLSTAPPTEGCPVLTRSSLDLPTYDTLPNPYALEVMQEVYDTYSETEVTLEATDLYVKFMPKDSIELHRLMYDYDLELFDYPLDIMLEEGEEYVPSIPETDVAWLYTTVKPDFVFPSGIAYEILYECYIPSDDEIVGIPTKAGDMINVEAAAFALLGYTSSPVTKSAYQYSVPEGHICMLDDTSGKYIPVKGVKVRCQVLTNIATDYTDEEGNYIMEKSFLFAPLYSIVFENVKGFDIWNNWGPVAVSSYSLGVQSNVGYNKTIDKNFSVWPCAAINNAAYEYYRMCEQTGILKPPADLKIWEWDFVEESSAPMLRQIEDYIGYNGHSDIGNFFVNIGYGNLATSLNQVFKVFLPDITIGTKSRNGGIKSYDEIYYAVNHELAHASHFSRVGSSFWAKYISYIMTYGAYGDGTGNNAELCGIGEMWGYAMGCIQRYERANSTNTQYPRTSDRDGDGRNDAESGWIYPHVFWDLYTGGYMTKKQIYDCLIAGVDTYNELVERLYLMNPWNAVAIESVLKMYPEVKHNVVLLGMVGGPYDAVCMNRTVSSSAEVAGKRVHVENATVSGGARLTINAVESITIDKPFIVNRDAELVITRGN